MKKSGLIGLVAIVLFTAGISLTPRVAASDVVEPNFSIITTFPYPLTSYSGNPVLTANTVTDRQANFVADPFMFYENGTYYIFFEVWSSATTQEIGLATSNDAFHWTYKQIVLHSSGHLAFPQVFKDNGNYYMTCDPCASTITIYKATNFPYNWTAYSTVGPSADLSYFADPSTVYYNGTWWLFASTGPTISENCYIFYASSLAGPWQQHTPDPVISNNAAEARNGGRIEKFGSRLIRLVQKCDTTYGQEVRAFQIDTLTPTAFSEHEIPESPLITASGSGWNAEAMHTLDPWWNGTNWIACVDGETSSSVWSIGIYYTTASSTPPPADSHDIAVINVVPSTVQAVAGTIININVTAKNEGAMTETFKVTTYYNSSKIGTQTVTNLAAGATRTLTFHWKTSGLRSGNYSIMAIAGTVPGETDTADNVYVDGTVMILNPPTAKFTYSPLIPRVNQTVLFDASKSSTPNGGTITNYKWSFGDGNATSTQNPTTNHAYKIAGTYKVTLTITDSKGLTASAQTTIRVRS